MNKCTGNFWKYYLNLTDLVSTEHNKSNTSNKPDIWTGYFIHIVAYINYTNYIL